MKMTIEDKYDFYTHKVIPQPDPSHPARRPTVSMLAFSETLWSSKMDVHLERSIPKLKEKDWEKIMQDVVNFMGSVILKPGDSKGKGRALPDEPELSWDSDDSD